MGLRILVDETKAKNYVMVAVSLAAPDAVVCRDELRRLVLPGQRGVHMRSEGDRRRRRIASTVLRLGEQRRLRAVVIDAGRSGTQKERRALCLRSLAATVPTDERVHVVLDRDESLENWDRQHLIDVSRRLGLRGHLTYEHLDRAGEPLLAIPDAIAWCWARGGEWRQSIAAVISYVDARGS